jgi:uncharacterized membrane protein YecN with MAPEG domain
LSTFVEIGKVPASLGHETQNGKGKIMLFTVTSLYALPLAAMLLVLWFRVSAKRASLKQSIGDGGDPQLLLRIRQHGNFVEWTGMILILMILAEGIGAPAIYLHISGALLLFGRIVHPFGLKIDNSSHPLRIVGNSVCLLATLNLMVCLGTNLIFRVYA